MRRLVRVGAPSRGFDWLVVVASYWIMAGAYLDSWAHRHVLRLDTFFTPYHAVLYSGLLAATLIVVGRLAWAGLPQGYGISLAGCLLFGLVGLLDLAWHTAFGIERGLAAALSPTHLLLMLSAGMIVAGPVRAAWRSGSRTATWPAVLAAAGVLAALTFFGQFDHPFINQWAAAPGPPSRLSPDPFEELGVLGVILQTAFISVVVLMLVARQRLPVGAITVILSLSGVLVTLLNRPDPVILVAVLTGIFGDVVYRVLRPSAERTVQLRAFAVVLPLFLWSLYFYGIWSADGIWWPVHIVFGAIVASGICGLLISYLVVGLRIDQTGRASGCLPS